MHCWRFELYLYKQTKGMVCIWCGMWNVYTHDSPLFEGHVGIA